MDGVNLRVGSVVAVGGELRLSATLEKDGSVWIDVFVSSYERRGSGILLRLRPSELDSLEGKVREARAVAKKLAAVVV